MPAKRNKPSSPAAKKKTTRAASKKKATTTRPDEMSAEVIDFITAIDDYKRKNERPFPNWSEVLEILKDLGYEKASA